MKKGKMIATISIHITTPHQEVQTRMAWKKLRGVIVRVEQLKLRQEVSQQHQRLPTQLPAQLTKPTNSIKDLQNTNGRGWENRNWQIMLTLSFRTHWRVNQTQKSWERSEHQLSWRITLGWWTIGKLSLPISWTLWVNAGGRSWISRGLFFLTQGRTATSQVKTQQNLMRYEKSSSLTRHCLIWKMQHSMIKWIKPQTRRVQVQEPFYSNPPLCHGRDRCWTSWETPVSSFLMELLFTSTTRYVHIMYVCSCMYMCTSCSSVLSYQQECLSNKWILLPFPFLL